MLSELCKELNNWDFNKRADKHIGDFEITGGELIGFDDILAENQYFRIVGSLFNDGIYKYPASDLEDEKFHGGIWAMAIPDEVIALADEIEAWIGKYDTVDSPKNSPYSSESFGGYSYTKGTSYSSTDANRASNWQGVFASKLNKWRKI